jgi:hypothetical protein
MLCEQMHYRDGGDRFPQSTFQVTSFVPHPVGISEPPDKNLDYLSFRNKFIMHYASMMEKQAALFPLTSTPVVLSWGQVKQDSCSTKIIVWFQRHNCKPTS